MPRPETKKRGAFSAFGVRAELRLNPSGTLRFRSTPRRPADSLDALDERARTQRYRSKGLRRIDPRVSLIALVPPGRAAVSYEETDSTREYTQPDEANFHATTLTFVGQQPGTRKRMSIGRCSTLGKRMCRPSGSLRCSHAVTHFCGRACLYMCRWGTRTTFRWRLGARGLGNHPPNRPRSSRVPTSIAYRWSIAPFSAWRPAVSI